MQKTTRSKKSKQVKSNEQQLYDKLALIRAQADYLSLEACETMQLESGLILKIEPPVYSIMIERLQREFSGLYVDSFGKVVVYE